MASDDPGVTVYQDRSVETELRDGCGKLRHRSGEWVRAFFAYGTGLSVGQISMRRASAGAFIGRLS